MKVMLVFGTRPEAIKMCPLVLELKKRENFQVTVCVTSQHLQMLSQVLEAFQVKPDYDLKIMRESQTLSDITRAILADFMKVLDEVSPDVVLVHGDTTTAFASALSCFYRQIPIGHVEAGLRTHDIYSPYPEEFNRKCISIVTKYHFVPTESARANLLSEGYGGQHIYVTGNTGIDALKTTVKKDYSHELIKWLEGRKLILITAHRRENLGKPMHDMFRAIRRIVESRDDVCAIYPVHLNPLVKEAAWEELSGCERIKLTEPLGVVDFHNFMARSHIILTDSGGIQEEAPSLGVPVLVMRDTTERPEGIEAGTLKLVGTSEDTIYEETSKLLTEKEMYETMSTAVNPYGDGRASERIADILSCV